MNAEEGTNPSQSSQPENQRARAISRDFSATSRDDTSQKVTVTGAPEETELPHLSRTSSPLRRTSPIPTNNRCNLRTSQSVHSGLSSIQGLFARQQVRVRELPLSTLSGSPYEKQLESAPVPTSAEIKARGMLRAPSPPRKLPSTSATRSSPALHTTLPKLTPARSMVSPAARHKVLLIPRAVSKDIVSADACDTLETHADTPTIEENSPQAEISELDKLKSNMQLDMDIIAPVFLMPGKTNDSDDSDDSEWLSENTNDSSSDYAPSIELDNRKKKPKVNQNAANQKHNRTNGKKAYHSKKDATNDSPPQKKLNIQDTPSGPHQARLQESKQEPSAEPQRAAPKEAQRAAPAEPQRAAPKEAQRAAPAEPQRTAPKEAHKCPDSSYSSVPFPPIKEPRPPVIPNASTKVEHARSALQNQEDTSSRAISTLESAPSNIQGLEASPLSSQPKLLAADSEHKPKSPPQLAHGEPSESVGKRFIICP